MVKLIMVGTCSECGQTITSRFPFELGECKCRNPMVQVELQPALVLAPRHMKKIEKVSELSDIPLEKLMDALLKEVSEAVMRGLKVGDRSIV